MFFISLPSSRSSRSAHSTAALKRTAVLFSAGVSVAILSLAGCGFLEGAQSADSADTAPSAPAEKIMSGEYEVGPDGKLLNPKRNDFLAVPQRQIAMNKPDAEGAEAFARFYVENIHYAWLSNDVSYLVAASDPNCDGCKQLISRTKDLKEASGWAYGGEYRLEDITRAFEIPDHPGIWHKELKHYRAPITSYNGKRIQEHAEEIGIINIQMRFDEEKGWLATAFFGGENEN